jgi:hypothetical protein
LMFDSFAGKLERFNRTSAEETTPPTSAPAPTSAPTASR